MRLSPMTVALFTVSKALRRHHLYMVPLIQLLSHQCAATTVPPIQRRLQCMSSSTDSIASGGGGFSGEAEAFGRGNEG